MTRPLTVMQLLPELNVGGVERGTIEIARALAAAGHRAIVVSAGGALTAELEACGATHITLGVGVKRPGSLRLIGALRRLYQEHAVDIVHARSRLPAWLGYLAWRGAGPQRPRWVTTVHGPYTVNRYSRIMTSGEAVIAISRFIRDYITSSYPEVDASRITVIPRGVDTTRYSPAFAPDPAWLAAWRERYPHLVGDVALLTLPGRLTRWKGQLDFIRMIGALTARGLRVHGLIAGAPHAKKTAFESELRAAVSTAGLDDSITFLGQRDDLREILSISTLAYSLTGEPEAFGRTTVEALSLGTPVVGYRHGGTAEILEALWPSGLVPIGDVDAAAARTAAYLGGEQPPVSDNTVFTTRSLQERTLAVYGALASGQADQSR